MLTMLINSHSNLSYFRDRVIRSADRITGPPIEDVAEHQMIDRLSWFVGSRFVPEMKEELRDGQAYLQLVAPIANLPAGSSTDTLERTARQVWREIHAKPRRWLSTPRNDAEGLAYNVMMEVFSKLEDAASRYDTHRRSVAVVKLLETFQASTRWYSGLLIGAFDDLVARLDT